MVSRILLLFLLLVVQQTKGEIFTHSSNGEIVRHSCYTLSYIEQHEQAEWVSYALTSEMIGGEAKRKNNFRIDPSVSSISAHPDDYKASGYDRGHLAPAASMSHTQVAMDESFYMSNMSPQHPSFNRGGWKRLEELVRRWALKEELLHVVTGALLGETSGTIGVSNKVSIPTHYYKVIYAPKRGSMIAFVMPNTKIESTLQEYTTTVDVVEKALNVDLFYELEDSLESRLESTIDLSQWAF